jgi:lysozyme
MRNRAFDFRWMTVGSFLVLAVAILGKPAATTIQEAAVQLAAVGSQLMGNVAPLVREKEGFVPTAYRDPGAGVLTIGYGTTRYPDGRPVQPGDVVTREEAERYLEQDIQEAASAVQRHVQVPLTEHELAALSSFTYNVGEGQFQKSTLVQKLNAGDRHGAANELLRWNKAGDKVLPGLVTRRKEERELFLGE